VSQRYRGGWGASSVVRIVVASSNWNHLIQWLDMAILIMITAWAHKLIAPTAAVNACCTIEENNMTSTPVAPGLHWSGAFSFGLILSYTRGMKTFSIKESIKTSWEIVKKSFWFVVGTTFIYLLFNFNINFSAKSGGLGGEMSDYSVTTLLLVACIFLAIVVFLWFLRTIVQIGYYRIYLKLLDGIKPSFRELFSNSQPFWRYVGSTILYGLRILLGFVLLIVPGIIWGIKFQFMPILTVDKGLRPVEAMRESARMTEGHKWHLFKFGLVIMAINLLGLICFGVGILVTIPLSYLAHLYVYRKLSLPSPEVANI